MKPLAASSDACPAEEPPWGVGVDPLAEVARESFQFLWRTMRRLGVQPDVAVDDAVQQVFEIAVRKRAQIEPGRERAYLFKTAILVAADTRRAQRRAAGRLTQHTHELADPNLDPEQAADAARHRALLDEILSGMSDDLRVVFVLFELEHMTSLEISQLLGIAPGTVASRLRRCREQFQEHARRMQARESFRGGR